MAHPKVAFGRRIFRSCCGQSHPGPVCPDGLVMCCLCFERVPIDQLATDPDDGQKVDVCQPCREYELAAIARRDARLAAEAALAAEEDR